MAFNPFNIFRRNQRVIFAVVTVFVMFTFVLSSGAFGSADFFNWFPNWLGRKTQKGDAIFELDGRKYYARDLSDIRLQRIAANQYMSMAAGATMQNLRSDINNRLGKASSDNRTLLTNIHRALAQVMEGNLPPNTSVEEVRRNLADAQNLLLGIIRKKESPPADAEIARDLAQFSTLLNARLGAPRDMYFTNIPNKTDRDVIEFLLWSKKADQQGIHFTDKDVQTLVIDEFVGRLGESEKIPRRNVLEDRRITDTQLWAALGQEFRVRLAQSSVLGSEMRRMHHPLEINPPPVYPTPYDLFSTYRDLFSPTSYELLAIPVANYLDQVKETPTTQELEKLFQEFKSQDPNPALERPGFKEPRKAKIEWVSLTGKEPYYTKAAEEMLKTSELQARLAGLFSPSLIALVANVAVANDPDLALQNKYQSRADRFGPDIDQQYISGRAFSFMIPDASLAKPGNLASAIGAAGGSLMSGAPAALVASNAFALNMTTQEQKTRLKVSTPLLLGGLVPYSSFGPAVVGAFEATQALPKMLPPSYYRAELRREVIDGLMFRALTDDIAAFEKALSDKTKDIKDPAKKREAVKEYIDDFVRTRGATRGAANELRDEYTVGDDPGLAPLKAEFDRVGQLTSVPRPFGKDFFSQSSLSMLLSFFDQIPPDRQRAFIRQAQNAPDVPKTTLFETMVYPRMPNSLSPEDEAKPTFIVWRSEEVPAKTLLFQSARPKVEAAWKERKARELALKEAERIAAEITAKKPTIQGQVEQNLNDAMFSLQTRFTDIAKKDAIRKFTLPMVAPFETVQNFQDRSQPNVEEFHLDATTVMPYPSAEMQKKLLDERKKPTGTTFVMGDGPKDTFYVVSVLSRTERNDEQFRREVYFAPPTAPIPSLVYDTQNREAMKTQREAATALLKQEFKYENENAAQLDKGE